MWKLNYIVVSNQWIKEKIIRKNRNYFEVNENEDRIYQNVWDEAKAVHRGKFIPLSAYVEKK